MASDFTIGAYVGALQGLFSGLEARGKAINKDIEKKQELFDKLLESDNWELKDPTDEKFEIKSGTTKQQIKNLFKTASKSSADGTLLTEGAKPSVKAMAKALGIELSDAQLSTMTVGDSKLYMKQYEEQGKQLRSDNNIDMRTLDLSISTQLKVGDEIDDMINLYIKDPTAFEDALSKKALMAPLIVNRLKQIGADVQITQGHWLIFPKVKTESMQIVPSEPTLQVPQQKQQAPQVNQQNQQTQQTPVNNVITPEQEKQLNALPKEELQKAFDKVNALPENKSLSKAERIKKAKLELLKSPSLKTTATDKIGDQSKQNMADAYRHVMLAKIKTKQNLTQVQNPANVKSTEQGNAAPLQTVSTPPLKTISDYTNA